MTADEFITGLLGFSFGIGLWLATLNYQADPWERIAAACGYIPHPISDIAWEIAEREGGGYVGAAHYFTRSLRSANAAAGACMRKRYQPGWSPN